MCYEKNPCDIRHMDFYGFHSSGYLGENGIVELMVIL
jgi:hypothetical protein